MALKKILIANRGEIAIRIIRACQESKVKCLAVYSREDKSSFFFRLADSAVMLQGSGAKETYLNIDQIVGIARKNNCDAIHPGYGFLSENPRLVSACEEAGIKFIGPNAKTMRLTGDKFRIKNVLAAQGIPVLPSFQGKFSGRRRRDWLEQIGFPLIVKPTFGGGGKGMRIIRSPEDFQGAIKFAETIGLSAFQNKGYYIEKYLDKPRHIEVQLLADKHGNIVILGERECSIQRNHQKLIEESPSPALTPKKRRELFALANKAARAISYENAGTIEFLYDQGKFYFLEINARIQVEHPITEMLTGVDLVKTQIQIAAGESIDSLKKIRPRGWAIECRVNAEDPLDNFKPSPGRITGYRSPGGIGVRVDSGIFMGYSIPFQYDSLVSKLSVWGRDREEAVLRMNRALNEYVILGIKTTLPLQRAILREERFLKGTYDTGYLADNFDQLLTAMEYLQIFERTHDKLLEDVFRDGACRPDISPDEGDRD